MDNDELVESVAKRLHDLAKGPNAWGADTPTIGGIHWNTGFIEEYREKHREHARELIAMVQGSHANLT